MQPDFPLRTTALLTMLAAAACASVDDASDGLSLPIRYDADRFLLAPPTATGDTLTFLLDTGGGANMLYPASLDRFGITPDTIGEAEDQFIMASPPALAAGVVLPPWPPGPVGTAPLMVIEPPPGFGEGRSGFLGRTWFADRVWTLDYPGRRLIWHPDGAPDSTAAGWLPLGFQTDSAGQRTTHFPRIQAVVDGDTLDLLFDTGATVTLRDSVTQALSDGLPAVRGTSFIITSVIDRWLARHPDWRVIPNAERNLRFVEVPEISMGGVVIGPVWFIERPDANFTTYMSQWMDRPLQGALGGSALRELVVTIDYPRALLRVRRP
jgi:hypothetical protein